MRIKLIKCIGLFSRIGRASNHKPRREREKKRVHNTIVLREHFKGYKNTFQLNLLENQGNEYNTKKYI
jgi:hypothetical protein